MQIADDARLVLRWTCKACGHINYYIDSTSKDANEARKVMAEEMGCDPDDLSCIPNVLCCKKCEEAHQLPHDFGDDEE